VVVVDLDFRAGGDALGLAACEGEFPDTAVLVEEEVGTVAGPVGRFEMSLRDVGDAAIGGGNGNGFKGGPEDGFGG